MEQQIPNDLNERLMKLRSAFVELTAASAKLSVNLKDSIDNYKKELDERIINC